MENREKRDYCINHDCPSNYSNGEIPPKPNIIFDQVGIVNCQVCGHTSKTENHDSSRNLLLSLLEGVYF